MTRCRACGRSFCDHPDPIYHGIIPLSVEMARAELAFFRRESDPNPAAPCRPTGSGVVHHTRASLVEGR